MSLFPPLFLLKHHIVVLAHKFLCLYCVIWFFHLCFYLCYMNGLSMQLLLLCNVAWGILIHAVWHTYTAPCRTARDVNMSWVAYCMLYELLFCVCGQFCGFKTDFCTLAFCIPHECPFTWFLHLSKTENRLWKYRKTELCSNKL